VPPTRDVLTPERRERAASAGRSKLPGRGGSPAQGQYRARMASKRQPYRRTIGTPATLVLYRTVDTWRYAIYFTGRGGIADGALGEPASSSEPGVAQAACHRLVPRESSAV